MDGVKVMGLQDSSIGCFDMNTGACLGFYKGHTAAVSAVTLRGHHLFSSAHDGTVLQI